MVRAARLGALDYKKIRRTNVRSLALEMLILGDIERDIMGEFHYRSAMYRREMEPEKAEDHMNAMAQMEIPWRVMKVTEAPKSRAEEMVAMYHRVMKERKDHKDANPG